MIRVIEYFAKTLKIIENGTVRKLGYGFLFALNCGRIFGRFDTIHERDRCQTDGQTLHDGMGRTCA